MSLHWILMLTVTLLHCLTAAPITKDKEVPVYYDDIKDLIKDLKDIGCNADDTAFYSPSGSNNCAISALNCSIQELETYKNECKNSTDDDKSNIFVNLVDRLKESLEIMVQTQNSKNCACEGLEEKPYDGFLNNILTLLQREHSKLSDNVTM